MTYVRAIMIIPTKGTLQPRRLCFLGEKTLQWAAWTDHYASNRGESPVKGAAQPAPGWATPSQLVDSTLPAVDSSLSLPAINFSPIRRFHSHLSISLPALDFTPCSRFHSLLSWTPNLPLQIDTPVFHRSTDTSHTRKNS